MENASKALIMAGSVLMAILVISILVFGYNRISHIEQTKDDSEEVDKMQEYMMRFEQFNRGKDNPLYGSELLSLANLQEDYNKSDARVDVGYDKIIINVKINKSIDKDYFSSGNHDILEILNYKDKLIKNMSEYEKPKYNKKSVKYYSKKSYREIAVDFGIEVPSNWGNDLISELLYNDSKTSKLMQDIQEYINLETIYNQFRTGKKFYCESVEYNRYNGRLKTMNFVEV